MHHDPWTATYIDRLTDQVASQANTQGGNPEFQQRASSSLTKFHSHVLAAQTTLSELAADKGLANFDNKAELEVILKDLANAIKEVLNDLTALVAEIPVLGPALAPGKPRLW